VRRLAIFIATTSGPVRVERITRERAPQSMACLKRTSTVLPISAAYDSFVRPGSGVIERLFGPFEPGAFRLDVSGPIEVGESWQLGVLAAHAAAAMPDTALAAAGDADAIAWMTGHVDHDLAVGAVGHLAEKVHASREAIVSWLAAGRSVTLFVPEGVDHAEAVAAGVPAGARVIAVSSATQALISLGLKAPAATVPRAKMSQRAIAGWIFASCATVAVGITVTSHWPGKDMQAALPKPAVVGTVPAPMEMKAQPVAASAPPVLVPAVVVASEPPPPLKVVSTDPPQAPKPVILSALSIFERRPPVGRTCAEVHFDSIRAVQVPVAAEEGPTTRTLDGLCGIGISVDNGKQPLFVTVAVDVVSGKLLSGSDRPDRLAGAAPFSGRQAWNLDLPRRLDKPFEIRVIAVSSDHEIGDEAQWFTEQPDSHAAAKELAAKGIAVSVLHHRILP